jgi:transcriptional regulator with GAF, ATPase, and Fis domain
MTDDNTELLLTLWQQITRHRDPAEAAALTLQSLRDQIPLEAVGLFLIDRPTRQLVSLCRTADGPTDWDSHRIEWADDDSAGLVEWDASDTRLLRGDDSRFLSWCDRIVPEAPLKRWWLGPLVTSGEPVGLVVFQQQAQMPLSDRQIRLAEAVLTPLAVVVYHDRKQREAEFERETVEAERQSLLTRLGRKRITEEIVGDRSGLRAVMERVELVARSDVPVLIFGETGTGKEVIARAIHSRSNRTDGPFHRVNCGAIPPELIDSELFGHQQGAFTGATETRKGWFERADGGTLFLDEIGELPPAAQVRLLRILQDGRLERVGGQEPIAVDVRIVAATHRDLVGMVGQGDFREDLWYRIAVFAIYLPPLRDRPGDVAELARHFALRAATRFGLPSVMPTDEDHQLLVGYDWPGNVRELGTVIDRAAILGNGRHLEVAAALGIGVSQTIEKKREGEPTALSEKRSENTSIGDWMTEKDAPFVSLETAMRRHIESALRTTGGKIEGDGGAAQLLEINPHTLRARMRKMGIDWSRFRN